MAARVHHNTMKKAKAHGIELVLSEVDGEIKAAKGGEVLAVGMDGKMVLDAALEKLNGHAVVKKARKPKAVEEDEEEFDEEGEEELDPTEDEIEAEGDEEDEEEGASVVKKKYKTRYRPFKATCGDEIAKLVRAHLEVEGEDGAKRIDEKKLVRFAKANDCWDGKYKDLNVGMKRMNVVNRLRAKTRKGHEVIWAN